MKKLLFVATASLCATVFGAIESSNVVGYQKKATVAGFNFVAPTFEQVTGAGVNVQEIVLDENGSEYSDSIQVLDDGGATAETYFWTADGWVDGATFELATREIAAGQGLLVDTANAGVTIKFPAAL